MTVRDMIKSLLNFTVCSAIFVVLAPFIMIGIIKTVDFIMGYFDFVFHLVGAK